MRRRTPRPPHTPPRGAGTPSGSPARTRALPSPRRRPVPSRPARPLPRGPTSVQSLPPARVRSRDGIRCQRRCQTPPVGGGEASADLLLSASHLPRPCWAQERGAPGRRLTGARRRSQGSGGRGHIAPRRGPGDRADEGWGASPNSPACTAPRAAAAARQRLRQRQSKRGRGRVRRGLMEVPGSRRRRRRRCPSSLPSSPAPGDGRGGGRHDGKFLGTGSRVQI